MTEPRTPSATLHCDGRCPACGRDCVAIEYDGAPRIGQASPVGTLAAVIDRAYAVAIVCKLKATGREEVDEADIEHVMARLAASREDERMRLKPLGEPMGQVKTSWSFGPDYNGGQCDFIVDGKIIGTMIKGDSFKLERVLKEGPSAVYKLFDELLTLRDEKWEYAKDFGKWFPIEELKAKAADARAYANKWCEDGENHDGVSYECLDHYARGLEDAVRLVMEELATLRARPLPPLTHVALRVGDQVFSLPAPYRHHHILNHVLPVLGVKWVDADDRDQGFVDAAGRYLTRKAAKRSAEANGQIKNGEMIGSVLTSEDLW